ncbi:MAG: hypothetical protein ACREI3_00105 [Nitrospirales bacterium]
MRDRIYRELYTFLRGAMHVLYHVGVITLSAVIAVSLPELADAFLAGWAFLQNDQQFLLYAEICFAICLIALFNYFARSTKDRQFAQMAQDAGLSGYTLYRGPFTQKRTRELKTRHGMARRIMIIGSTGYKSLVDPDGDLHLVVKNCLEAKILLLNPYSPGAWLRAKTLEQTDVTMESLGAQVRITIDFLKTLQAAQKNIQLKLYSDPPHVKLGILGEHIWLQHYHTSLDVLNMPEYVFTHNQKYSGLYTLFYEYFLQRWNSLDIPEYDLETDELVYRDRKGGEKGREPFSWGDMVLQRSRFSGVGSMQPTGRA